MAGLEDLERDHGPVGETDGLAALERDHGPIGGDPGTVATPAPAAPKSPSGSDYFNGAIAGAVEGHPLRGIAKRAASGLMALDGALYSKKSVGELYDEYMQQGDKETADLAERVPETYAPAKIAGGVAGAMTTPPGIYAGLEATNAALDTKGSIADKAGAAALAGGTTFALGRLGSGSRALSSGPMSPSTFVPGVSRVTDAIGRYVGTPSPRMSMALNAGLSAKTALDPDAAAGDRWAAAGNALVPGISHLASAKSRKAATLEEPRRMAERDLEEQQRTQLDADAMKRAAEEQAAVGAVEKERTQTDRQNEARTSLAEGAEKQVVGAIESVGKNVDRAHASQVADVKDAARERAAASRDARANDYDARARVARDAREAARAQAKADNDTHRLAKLDADDAFDARLDAYERQKADRDAYVARQEERGKGDKARANRYIAEKKESSRLKAEFEKRQEDIGRDFGETLEGVDPGASIAGKIGEMFRETHTRLDNLIRGSERHDLPVNPEYVSLHKYLTETLNGNTPRKVADLIEFRRDPKAWVAKEMQAAGERQARTHDAPAPEAGLAPDFAAEARKNLDSKEQAKGALEAEAAAAVAAENAGRESLGDEPPEPVAPNRRAEQAGIRDFVRKRIENGTFPLPEAPDAITKREADRGERTTLRSTLAGAESRVPYQPIADAHDLAPFGGGYKPPSALPAYPDALVNAGRADPGLVLPKRAAISPRTGPGETVADRVSAARRAAGQNLEDTLKRAPLEGVKVAGSVPEQYLQETANPAIRRAIHALVAATAGGATAGPAGAAGGAYLGSKMGQAPESVLTKFLGQRKGDDGISRYADPAEAAELAARAQAYLEKKSPITDSTHQQITTAAAMAAVVRALEERRREAGR